MKKHFTEFTCDRCGKKISKLQNTGYPYTEGWVFIYNLELKLSINYAERIVEKDKHFCDTVCMKDFLMDRIDNISLNRFKLQDKEKQKTERVCVDVPQRQHDSERNDVIREQQNTRPVHHRDDAQEELEF